MDIKFCATLLASVQLILVRAQTQGCDGQGPMLLGYRRFNGEFWTPNFPMPYQNETFCQWNITTPDSSLTSGIRLELFDFVLGVDDYVRVYDGKDSSARMIIEIRGGQTPPLVASTGPAMFIIFQSMFSSISTGYGFRAAFNADPACTSGGRLVAFGDITHSPSYPNNYPQGHFCVWNFVGPEDEIIIFEIIFIDFKLEGTLTNCKAGDYFDVYVDGTLYQTFCSYKYPNSFNVTGNAVRVVFGSNLSSAYPGLRFQVKDYPLVPLQSNSKIST